MEMPNYDGIIEKWKVNLIIHRAKRHGFKPHEIPDALQEVTLVLLEFKYDADRSNGATERTALTTVIDNHLRKMKRSTARYRKHIECLGQDATEFSHEEIDPLTLDVADVVDGLSAREQVVCRGLADGLSKSQLARQMGCGWHTIDRIVRSLRERFEQLGLDGWVDA
jgi:DNA-directed RNA polymerase specialized sigma24 family protein